MIAEDLVRQGFLPRLVWQGRAGRRHRRLRAGVPAVRTPAPSPGTVWARFWDDRQAVRLKVILVAGCLLAAMLLEVPW